MMLDVKRTWDDLVTRHAPDPARRERILKNRLYRQMSSALAGSQEYMAMEKLYDSPPTALRPHRPRHAADRARARLPRRA